MKSKMNVIDQMLEKENYNGSILIADQTGILLHKHYGFADFELGVKNSEDSVFRIASISKQITAVAILKCIEQGKLKLEDTLDLFIPDYPRGNEIKIRHLLTHSSGIANFELYMDFYDVYNAEDFDEALIKVFKDEPLMFDPGTEYMYSVSGNFLLSYIIKLIHKSSFEDYLKTFIFKPLGMIHSYFDYWDRIIPNRVKNYNRIQGVLSHSQFMDMRIAGGGGGLLSSAHDLYLFQKALNLYQIISKESYEAMFSPKIRIIESTDYGYGVFLAHDKIGLKERRKNYHTGGGPGVRSIMIDYPDDQIQCIMISNVNDRDLFNHLSEKVEEIIFENL